MAYTGGIQVTRSETRARKHHRSGVASLPRQVSYNQRGDAARYATEVLTSSISAGAAVLTAVGRVRAGHDKGIERLEDKQ